MLTANDIKQQQWRNTSLILRRETDGNEVCASLPRREDMPRYCWKGIFFLYKRTSCFLKKICPLGIVFIIKENWRGISTLHSLRRSGSSSTFFSQKGMMKQIPSSIYKFNRIWISDIKKSDYFVSGISYHNARDEELSNLNDP